MLAVIATELVDYPEQVKVKEIDGVHTMVLELSVAKGEIGKIIGKKGQNIGAIRAVMNAASAKIQKRIIVEILE